MSQISLLFFLFSLTLKICVYICTHYIWRHIFWDVNKKGKCVAFGILVLRRESMRSRFQHTVSTLSPTLHAEHLFVHLQPLLPSCSAFTRLINKVLGLLSRSHEWVETVPKASNSNLGPGRYLFPKKCVHMYFRPTLLLFELLSRRNEQAWRAQKQKEDNIGNCNVCLFLKIIGALLWSRGQGAGLGVFSNQGSEEICPFTWCFVLALWCLGSLPLHTGSVLYTWPGCTAEIKLVLRGKFHCSRSPSNMATLTNPTITFCL